MNERKSLMHLAGAAALALIVHASATAAVPTLAPYPAPGGNAAAGIGDPAKSTGRTWTLSGFDNNAYDKLYYTIGDYTSSGFDPAIGPLLTTRSSTSDRLSFNAGLSNLAAGVAVWSGSTVVFYNCGTSSCSSAGIGTRFTLTVTDTSSNALALISPGTVGLGFAGALLDVQGDFKANWLFEAQDPTASMAWKPSLDMYDALPKSSTYLHTSSVGGAFYSTPPVPEPSTWAMMATSLVVIAWRIRRRKDAGLPAGRDVD